MRKLFLFVSMLTCVLPGVSQAGVFSPAKLTISAPQNVMYRFDGARIKIPVTVGGTPADMMLCVFPIDEGYGRPPVRSGYLGWHYINGIDTCIYLSEPYHFQPGENTIDWNGRDENGNILKFTDFVKYFIWGYDSVSAGQEAAKAVRFGPFDRSYLQTTSSNGTQLDRPVLYDAPQTLESMGTTRVVRTKWIIGSDPANLSLAETTAYISWRENSRIALDPDNDAMFFTQAAHPDGQLVLQKYLWAPNGNAVLQTAWGEEGKSPWSARPISNFLYSGPVSNNLDYLHCTGLAISEQGEMGCVYIADINDGCLIKKLNLGSWWSDGAGPAAMSFRQGRLFINSPFSCMAVMADPYREDDSQFVIWANGNGDGIGDRNFEPDSRNPWACSDFTRPPFAGCLSADRYLFSVFPAETFDAASFGAFAPDGSGFGYFTIPGMKNGSVHGMHIADAGSPYDGLYYGGISADNDSSGVWYRGYASVRGRIGIYQDFWGPFIMVREPVEGDCLVPGSFHRISWISDGVNSVRIEFSSDRGVTWSAITDSTASTGMYFWTVPAACSENCFVRVIDRANSGLSDVSYPFTIRGPSAVSEDVTLHQHLTVSNRPNPFNPSTVIQYELGLPGRVMLTVYNALGQRIILRELGFKSRGAHEYRFDGSRLTSGVYFYRVETENAAATGKMLLVR